MEAVIKYTDMLNEMRHVDHRGNPARFDIEYVKCSLSKPGDAENGKIGKKQNVCLLKLLPNQSSTFGGNFSHKPRAKSTDQLPKPWEEKLLKLADPVTGAVIHVYSRLILTYNGITVTE